MKTILFVDDDPVIIHVYRGALKNAGYRVEVAADGLEAMKVLPELCPHLVVLDVLMPKIDGAYVLNFIRSRPELKATKVIVLSGVALSDAAKATLVQNPDRVYLKSEMTPKELLEAINEMLDADTSTQ